jgi:hypothetical protein
LEEATLDSKKRNIDTPEVWEALDTLEPYCFPKWRVEGFRHALGPRSQNEVELEGQQQFLRAHFGGIYKNVRGLLLNQIGRLELRYRKTKDAAVKAEMDRLNAELERLPKDWMFVVR